MSGFLPNEPTTFINIKLTDQGRSLLSLGKLNFATAALSDRQINYGIDRSGIYSIASNRVLAPKDNEPTFSNFDGSTLIPLGQSTVASTKQTVTATTVQVGMFSGCTNAFGIDQTKIYTQLTISYSGSGLPQGISTIHYDPIPVSLNSPSSGQLIYIPWEPIQNSGKTYDSSTMLASGNPTNGLWYRIMTADTTGRILYLDKPTPNFGSVNTSQKINAYVYPFNAVDTYYSTAYTTPVTVWNMNIIRTSSIPGTNTSMSGYTSYGSIEFNGIKSYLGFSSETRDFGVIHFTNFFTGNTYAEKLVEQTVEINLPSIMWHRNTSNAGQGVGYGLKLTDNNSGGTTFDSIANTSYRFLTDEGNFVVGRVYHSLQIVIITDSELLTTLSYKANRNYTLPQVGLNLVNSPKFPLNNSQATGLCASGNSYYVTYITKSNEPSVSGKSYGYPTGLHCGYISKIDGHSDINGNPTFLNVTFPNNAFPYMRNSVGMTTYSGTGWNANSVQILVNSASSSMGYDFDTIPSNGWVAISNGIGNGIYTGDTTDNTIDPLKLQGYNFTISQQDYNSGTTYNLDPTFTSNSNILTSGLTFGNESFLFGTFKSGILATSFKTSIVVLADSNAFNASNNPTFKTSDNTTYITEIGIFADTGDLVGIGKPTYPISKSNSRFLVFKLEYDF